MIKMSKLLLYSHRKFSPHFCQFSLLTEYEAIIYGEWLCYNSVYTSPNKRSHNSFCAWSKFKVWKDKLGRVCWNTSFIYAGEMVQKLACGLFLFLGFLRFSHQERTKLHIGTLIPWVAYKDNYGFKRAIEFAAETIYKQGLLPGYELVFHHKETYVSWDHVSNARRKTLITFVKFFKTRECNRRSTVILVVICPSIVLLTPYPAHFHGVLGVTSCLLNSARSSRDRSTEWSVPDWYFCRLDQW